MDAMVTGLKGNQAAPILNVAVRHWQVHYGAPHVLGQESPEVDFEFWECA